MKSIAVLLLLTAAASAGAGQHAEGTKPVFYASQTETTEAIVEEIDYEARLVTLRQQDGSTVTFTPSPDVHNLDQVSPGDILHVEVSHSVAIQVTDADGLEPAEGAMSAIARTEEGEMPALIAVDKSVLLASVVAIDLEAQTYKLQFADGSVNEYAAMNPENLKLAAVGDVVSVEVTDSVVAEVISVD